MSITCLWSTARRHKPGQRSRNPRVSGGNSTVGVLDAPTVLSPRKETRMIVTEEEAKTKRCQESFSDGWTTPDGRMATLGGAAHGTALVASPYFCIGSACMAWRWWLSDGVNGIDRSRGDDMSKGLCGKANAR